MFLNAKITDPKYLWMLPLARDVGGVFSETYINWSLSGISAVDLNCKNIKVRIR